MPLIERAVAAAGSLPTRMHERDWHERGAGLVAGLDEVGRGPLAGPVVAGAVILDPARDPDWLPLLRDSKQLSEAKREALAALIHRDALAVGLGFVPAERIDETGIAPASREAMCQALLAMRRAPHALLLDAFPLPEVDLPQLAIVRGDSCCSAIAAAAIVAKVARDHLMVTLDGTHPGYGFARNRGYGTSEHIAALQKLGPSAIHRRCFAPLRQMQLL